MPEVHWGVKRLCPSCGNRFYDLANNPTTCPVCGATHSLDSLTLKRGRPERPDAKLAAAAAAARGRVAEVDEEAILDTEEEIDVGDDVLEDDEEDETVPLEDLGDRPGDEPEV